MSAPLAGPRYLVILNGSLKTYLSRPYLTAFFLEVTKPV
jgi:hypothetical protein